MTKVFQMLAIVVIGIALFFAVTGHPIAIMFCAILAWAHWQDKRDEKAYREGRPFK